METARIAEITKKLDISDINWDEAKAAGLSEDERFILTYFADIESQTIMYMRDLLHTNAVNESDVLAFLGIWNYEEYFHGYALGELMKVCGNDLGEARIANVRKMGTLQTKVYPALTSLLSRIAKDKFVTMYMTWGAIQELTTHEGYERIQATSPNPVLVELCKRINKQERVHFSWYYNNAKKRLEASESAQKFTRFMLTRFWTPVGAGIKRTDEVARLFNLLFPEEHGLELAELVDSKIGALPGLKGISIMRDYLGANVRSDLASKTAAA